MTNDNEHENGFPDSAETDSSHESARWKILVVDDEEDVHTVTRLALEDIEFEGERPRILTAYSGEEGRRMIAENPDIAIVLLDVVMETQTSGLDMVKYIRRDLGNSRVRIILRTGHPGQAPERQVVEAFDINDYKTKTELTSDNLFTIIIAGLRSYKNYLALETYGRDLERKVRRRTRELAKSEDRFAKAFHASPSLMAITTLENGLFLDVNDRFVRATGYDREELIGVGSMALGLWADPGDRVALIEALHENKRVRDMEIRLRTKSGAIRSLLFSGEVIHLDNEPCLITVANDITDRARMEQMLRESEERMRTQFKSVPVPTYIWRRVGEDFTLIDFNDAAMKITNGVIKKFMGVSAGELYYDEPDLLDGMRRCFEKKTTLEHEIHYRMKSTPDSKHLAVKYAFAPPDLVLIHTEDLTEKKTLQAEAIRAGHLASLGELAAGIAHEINNPINGIISYAELLKDQFDDEGEDDEIPVRIIKEGDRVAKIVRNLLSFARDRKEESSPALIRDILSDSLGLTGSQIKKDGIQLTMDAPADLPRVRVRTQEIQQVFLNIISNSRYALNRKFKGPHEDKIIEIKVEAIDIRGKHHVRITFHDAGVGIPGDVLGKISNPFFSTKPPGEGTGLGLSISHGIVESHGGKLRFESVEGEYAKVVIDLPAGARGAGRGG